MRNTPPNTPLDTLILQRLADQELDRQETLVASAIERVAIAKADEINARRKAILAEYPNDYVVFVGERMIAHTSDKEAAFAAFDAAWDGQERGNEVPLVVPPASRRGDLSPLVLRGRALPRGLI